MPQGPHPGELPDRNPRELRDRRHFTDSTAAQRTSREPCLVIRPRCTVVSDSWCFGVSPAHDASCGGPAKRVMSPISATNTAASTGPIPGICWIACSRGRCAAGRRPARRTGRSRSPARRSAAAASRSAAATRAGNRTLSSSRCRPRRTGRSSAPAPRRLASTAWTWHFSASATRPAWPGAAPAPAAPGSPAGRSTPRVAGPSAADRPDPRRRGRRSSPAGTQNAFTPNGCARCTVRAAARQRVDRPVVG